MDNNRWHVHPETPRADMAGSTQYSSQNYTTSHAWATQYRFLKQTQACYCDIYGAVIFPHLYIVISFFYASPAGPASPNPKKQRRTWEASFLDLLSPDIRDANLLRQ